MSHPTAAVGGPEVALLRLVAQGLVGARADAATDVVQRLTAVQAQDLRGALTSVALRTAPRTVSEVEAALDAGHVVRSWPMRGTLHLVAAEDLAWMLELTGPRLVVGAAARRAELQLDPATVERARDLAVGALSGGRRLARADLLAVWDRAGVATSGQRGYHLLAHLAQTGTLCLGPTQDGAQLFVLLEEWVPRPRLLTRDEALGEWALRYFRSHGPATAKDFARWTGLLAADVKVGIALARSQLAGVLVKGVENLMEPLTPDLLATCRDEAGALLLLPGFDELVLGYADRSATVPPAFAERIVPGRNGVFRPTVVSGGTVVGTWCHAGRKATPTLEATPFTEFTAAELAALPAAYAALPR